MAEEKVKLDAATKKWFENQPVWIVTTLSKCEKCGLYYKDALGHKCKARNDPETPEVETE